MDKESRSTYNLIVKFSGLCAFVPTEEIAVDTASVSAMHVLLVAANVDNKIALEKRFLEVGDLREHFAFLAFNLANLPDVSSLPEGEDSRGVWHLRAEEISFKTGVEDTRVYLRRTGAELPYPSPDQESDFIWIPNLEDVAEGAGYVDELLIHPDDSVNEIAACVHLRGGEVSVSDLGAPSGGRPPMHRFLPTRDPRYALDQALASEIEWKVSGLREDLVVTLRQFKDNAERHLVLRPQLNSDGTPRDIVISLVNLCAPSIFHYVGRSVTSSGVPRPDADFTWMYLLSNLDKPDSYPVIPAPILFGNASDGGVEPQICSGGVTRPPVSSIEVEEQEEA